MTIDEAIKHAEEVADTCEYEASRYDITDAYESYMVCQEGKCAEEHRQLAEWLKELKHLREQTRWIPVSERLPEIHQDVLLSFRSLNVEVGFRAKTEPYFGADGDYIEPQNVLAWQPLPEPYRAESEE